MDYLKCLKYYRRDEDAITGHYLNCLNGLQLKFDELPNILKAERHDKSYEESLIFLIKNIEHIYDYKKAREIRRIKKEIKY